MKKLTDDERKSLSEEKAREILADYGKFLENSPPTYNLESELPWDKTDILFAAWYILAYYAEDESMRAALHVALDRLLNTLPDPDQYKSRMATGRLIRGGWELKKAGFSSQEIANVTKRIDFRDDNSLEEVRKIILKEK